MVGSGTVSDWLDRALGCPSESEQPTTNANSAETALSAAWLVLA
jgi:hypothetical protein